MAAEPTAWPRVRPSISDVALDAGVSRAAVSKVIRNAYGVSPAMRTRVETSIAKLGYRPRVAARAMRGASFTIGFQVPNLENDFFAQIVEGAASTLVASAYQLIIAPGLGPGSQMPVLDALVDRQVDGIIAIASTTTADLLEQLGQQVPVVVLGRHYASAACDTVNSDDRAGADQVMDHLIGLGHTRIAHLTIRTASEGSPHAIRLAAYRQRMRAEGLVPQVARAENTERDAYGAALELLSAPDRPTAVFAAHDALAVEVLRAVGDLRLTAADVSVVGYDNVRIAQHPLVSLTTVDQFGLDVGRIVVELLLERIRDGRTSARHHRVPPELRVRSSTRALS